MALSPEDVLNKTFTQTQFRRGYDEREVDDFLDDIVAEMRRMTKESDDLRGDLNTCREGKGMAPVVTKARPTPRPATSTSCARRTPRSPPACPSSRAPAATSRPRCPSSREPAAS